ncbi:alcohol dehydrogenase class IV [Peribacillus deserti]|uniref:Alcohol dehydrogenase class IV n=1 Tax=Peribacillus deserti TaxID=673318 RepID=A0ABS2QN35_9BACI|nr:iron-containing alcohol dehydrogenase [Peribacillus deserti]MBM7693686.1 alcohol dehydrogenase class IV [Peribacillus deserti]
MKLFASPKKIITGEGSIKNISAIVKDYKAKRVFIFADPIVVHLGLTNELEAMLQELDTEYSLFTKIEAEPPIAVGDQAVQAVRDYRADLVIGIGGGSCLDIAKAASVLARNSGEISDFLHLTGTKTFSHTGLPKVLIPTTAGTGAEITDIAVFSLEDTKDVISHEFLLSDIAIIDPELTYTLPPRVTAASGVDALTHAIEAYLSINASILTDTLALEAVTRIAANIRTAVWQGENTAARNEMSWGSMLAGLSFYNAGVAGVHALAYPLGGLFKLPHGESNAVLLPYVLDYIWPSCMEKMIRLAAVLGLPVENKNQRDLAISVVQEIQNLIRDTGLPTTLGEYGITENDINRLAENGMKQTRLLARSPKPFSLEATKSIYLSALKGELALGR